MNSIISIGNRILLVLVAVTVTLSSCTEKNEKSSTALSNQEEKKINYLEESKEDFDKRMEWWRDAKFGMFIHWGPYAVASGVHKGEEVAGIGEWIMDKGHIPIKEYEAYSRQFNPTDFDAQSWAKLMKEAGMKYVVITSKHHDGFGLWDSKVSNYDIVDFSPYGKDVLKQLAEACKKEGIQFGLYHSIMDWHHPQAQAIHEPNYNVWRNDSIKSNPEFQTYVAEYLKPQLKELVENYDPAILWFDGEWIPDYTHENGLDIYAYVRSLKPDILINNRVDKGRQGLMGMNDDKLDYVGDFGTPEQEILEGTSTLDWESCMTMNDTWGFKKNDLNWKSAKTLIHNLIDVAAKGGNYLLNVGPTAEGLIPQPSIARLKRMGDWLAVNSEAIYETEKLKNNYKQGENIRYTKKKGEDIIYAIVLDQPENEVVFKYIKPSSDSEIYLLGSPQSLKWSYEEGEGLTIELPVTILDAVGEKEAWIFKTIGEEVD